VARSIYRAGHRAGAHALTRPLSDAWLVCGESATVNATRVPLGDRPPSVRTNASLTMQTRGLSRVSRLSRRGPRQSTGPASRNTSGSRPDNWWSAAVTPAPADPQRSRRSARRSPELSARTFALSCASCRTPTDIPIVLKELRWGERTADDHPHDDQVPPAATL